MNNDKSLKLCLLTIVSLFFFLLISTIIYMVTCSQINKMDSGIIFMNATDNRFDSDVFFSTEEAENTGFVEELRVNIDGVAKIIDSSETESINLISWPFLDKHKNEIINIALSNEKYMSHLEKNLHCSIEDLEKYISKMAQTYRDIFELSAYVTLVVMCWIHLYFFKIRKELYLVAALVYFIVTASVISNGLSDYTVFKVMSLFAKRFEFSLTYEDVIFVKKYFLYALKEALLTVFILDTIIEKRDGVKMKRREKDIRYIFRTIEIQIEFLSKHVDSSYAFVGKLKIPSVDLENQCEKESKKKREDIVAHNHQIQNNLKEELAKLLYFLRTNKNEKCLIQEYVSKMLRVKELMIDCELSEI